MSATSALLVPPRRGAVVAVASGKGGVGKTTVVANAAIALARLGVRAVVLDGDMGLANVDVLMGVLPKRTIEHFFREGVPLGELAMDGAWGVRVIPAGSGLPELTRLSPGDARRFAEGIEDLTATCDVVLIDTAAGIGEQTSSLAALADRVEIVTWPEPAALVDAYATIKVLSLQRPDQPLGIVVNGARDDDEAHRVHRRLAVAAERFLGRTIELDGVIRHDGALADAARRQRPILVSHPHCVASRAIERLALRLTTLCGPHVQGAMETPWQGMIPTADVPN